MSTILFHRASEGHSPTASSTSQPPVATVPTFRAFRDAARNAGYPPNFEALLDRFAIGSAE